MPRGARGQQEASFQWIFAMIGIVVFMGIFVVVFRSCASTGEQQVTAGSLMAGGKTLSSMAWQDATRNTTITANVDCDASLTLSANAGEDRVDVPLDNLPLFLPARLSGRQTIITKSVRLRSSGVSDSIVLGTVSYGIDAGQEYVLLEGVTTNLPLRTIELPRAREGTIIVTDGRSSPSPAVEGAYLVQIDASAKTAAFFIGKEGKWVRRGGPESKEPVPLPELVEGAIVTGDRDRYLCARKAFEERAGYVLRIAKARSNAIIADTSTPEYCKQLHTSAQNAIVAIDRSDGTLDSATLTTTNVASIMGYQRQLIAQSCPVIA
jgi:hypothetical protein